jgi:hypothetical protein
MGEPCPISESRFSSFCDSARSKTATAPLPPVPSNGLHILGGFAGVFGLLLLRARIWVGLHPIGFIGASVYSSWMLWFSVLWIVLGAATGIGYAILPQ